ncbi:MAG: metal ABC transporter ATP-binding protein [Acidimicrobiales bacterium]
MRADAVHTGSGRSADVMGAHARPDAAGDEPVLELDGVGAWMAGREILQDVRFAVGPGELVGLIGSNGAGKTTIFRVVLGLLAPTSGRVLLGGAPRPRRNRSVGYVPQKITLDPDMPLRSRDLVALGLDGHRLGVSLPSRRRRELVDEMLHAVGATGFADMRVGSLSGGEQQRVMIAHALVSRPKLLLLDEPLANLDLRSEQEVVGLVARIAKSQGLAVLVSAHDLNPLLPVVDRVAYVAQGHVASGTTEEVVTTEVLSQLYGHHVDVIRLHGRILVVASPGLSPELGKLADSIDDPGTG